MNLPEGVRGATVQTDRLRMRYIESGPSDGVPVVLIHGNLATGRFYEHVMVAAPERYRCIAPDMRGFGDTERVPIDADAWLARLGRRHLLPRSRARDHPTGASRGVVDRWRGNRELRAGPAGCVPHVRRSGFAVRLRRRAARRDALFPRLRGFGGRHGQCGLHAAHRGARHLVGLAGIAAQCDEQLVLGAGASRAGRPRGHAGRGDAQVGDRR